MLFLQLIRNIYGVVHPINIGLWELFSSKDGSSAKILLKDILKKMRYYTHDCNAIDSKDSDVFAIKIGYSVQVIFVCIDLVSANFYIRRWSCYT